MEIENTNFKDLLVVKPKIYRDNRGYFFENYNNRIGFNIVQANQSSSKYLTLRGLHYQNPPYCQAKLVQVVKGKVLDVVVDLRKDQNTFGKHYSIILDGVNKTQLYIPRGFAHGFITLSKTAIFQYYVDNAYSPTYEGGIIYNDNELNIDWLKKYKINISDKDRKLPQFIKNKYYNYHEWLQNPI